MVATFEHGGWRYVLLSAPVERRTLGELTSRERDVLGRAARGASNKVIAYELGISPSTVRVHMARAMAKLGAKSRTEAVTTFCRSGDVVGQGIDDRETSPR